MSERLAAEPKNTRGVQELNRSNQRARLACTCTTMSTIYNVGSAWRGFAAIRHLIIFGDSYSSVDDILGSDVPAPTPADPLSAEFPGTGVWNEPNEPNWVGHLLTKYRPGPRYVPPRVPHTSGVLDDQSKEWLENPLLVHDYALGGDIVAGVSRQVRSYAPTLGEKPDTAPWTPEDSLFVTWVGINDCAYGYRKETITTLFSIQEEVYNTGARNFLFINVPPINRSPAVGARSEETAGIVYMQWNTDLREAAKEFASTHPDCSVFLFSAYKVFNTLLDNPVSFGFEEADVKRRGGTFWVDHIHPTSKVHDYIAKELAEFLSSIPAKDE